jgi:UDP-N-acetylglucosamine 2-epimerase (non-hydrolysing)
MPLIDIVAGARPNFMKIAPIIRALDKLVLECSTLKYRLIHTGQHFDACMSADFFAQLDIPEPYLNMGVGSGTQSEQAGAIMVAYESLLLRESSDLCLVVGDVTSTMSCAIVAKKMCIPVAHVEAGIRSRDRTMPEEINRIITDSITDWFFTTSENANKNLLAEGINQNKIFFVGNTMIDTLNFNILKLRKPYFFDHLHQSPGNYFVLTLHRPSNVDNIEVLLSNLMSVADGARGLPVIFPIHPRTAKILKNLDSVPSNIHIVEPQPYLEFIYLIKNSKAVITDSGGISEEATILNVPCITLRSNTERPETVTMGTNVLVGGSPIALKMSLDLIFANKWKSGSVPDKWDGKTGERIVSILRRILCQ